MFLSGAWPTDGDSDAFNQIFYASSTNGKEWSVPKVVVSTDYSFSASAKQDEQLGKGEDDPLGVSAYFSGRAYGPAVVQNPDGSLTMVFSGYRLPKPITAVGTVLGTNPEALYTIGAKDPALYRNILTLHLKAATSPGVATTTSVASSNGGKGGVGTEVTYTATVAAVAPGAGTPTGSVSFSDSYGPIPGCGAEQLSLGSPDTATCTTQPAHPGSDEVSASYSGDANYAGSAGSTSETVTEAPTITSANATTFTQNVAGGFTVTATGTPQPTITESATLPSGVEFSNGVLSGTPTQIGTFKLTFTAHNGVGGDSVQEFTLTVLGLHVTTTSLPEATPGVHYSVQLQAEGGIGPYRWSKSGSLPKGLKLSYSGLLSGTVRAKSDPNGGSFPITVTVKDHTKKLHQNASAALTLHVA